jgi:hypothetical protein
MRPVQGNRTNYDAGQKLCKTELKLEQFQDS